MNNPITEETIRQAIPTSIGGKFFKTSTKENGIDTIVLNSVKYMNGLFDAESDDPKSFHNLKKLYSVLNTHGREFFFDFKDASVCGDYGIFSFYTNTEWKSLSELALPLDDEQALSIFKSLVKLIYNYSKSSLNAEKYNPLLFICKESVYFCYKEDKLQIMLLPLLFDPSTQYSGLPREIFGKTGDVTSDLYMAAYLYLSLKYPNGEKFDSNNHSQYDSIAERCLSPFIQRRYSAEQLIELLDKPETNNGSTNTVDRTARRIVSTPEGRKIAPKKTSDECEKDNKPKLSFLMRLLNKIIPMKNPVFDAAKTAVKYTTNGEKVTDLLSTQEGDEEENNE